MAIKTIVDGGKQAITYNNNTEPVAVYVDGELQQNVSFVPQMVQGTGTVSYESEYKKNHISIDITGTTSQDGTPTPDTPIPIQNANDNGISIVLKGENLFNAQGERKSSSGSYEYGNNYIINKEIAPSATDHIVYSTLYKAGTYTISAKGEYSGDSFIFRFLCTTNYSGGTYNSYYASYYYDLLKTDLPQSAFTFTTTEDFQIGFAWSGLPTLLKGKIYDIMLTPTNEGVKYKPYEETIVEIPTSITIDEKEVPLLFSEYDSLSVDRLNNKVVYENGTYKREFIGQEHFYESTYAENNGYGRYFIYSGDLNVDGGYCTHFRRVTWLASTTVTNVFSWVYISSTVNRVAFKTDGSTTDTFANDIAKFKEWIKAQYDAGTPVIVQAKRYTPIEYDITDTDLGQQLLMLETQNQTNYFEIISNPNAPQVPIEINYAKWGELVENNNNT